MTGNPAEQSSVPGCGSVLLPDEILFGHSLAMAEVHARANKICRANIPVLVCGDGGTGKEALAFWIHAHSEYSGGQFVKVNCAAIPGPLLESELFGYERGAFTGAHTSKPGRIEVACNGTLFLDEIADLDMALQSKILHFLQDGHFSRLGDEVERYVNPRVICATNKNLEQEIAAGKFRADLFYRINVVRLQLPPLRERKEDIPSLVEYFRSQYEKRFKIESAPLTPDILEYLQNAQWPGNIRELSNGMARYVLIGPEATFSEYLSAGRMEIKPRVSPKAGERPLKHIAKEAIREMERNLILESLRAHQWNRRKAAKALKISYRALIYKTRDAGLTARRPRAAISEAKSDGKLPVARLD